MYRLRAKHTRGSNPPPDLLPGELAYSDANKQFYVGRFDGSACTFESDLSLAPIDEAIASLETGLGETNATLGSQGEAIALLNAASTSQADAITLLDVTTITQADAIAAINTGQTDQDSAIAVLAAASSSQANAIDSLAARPLTYGFTYDQQAEPLSPAAGATWRERSAGGLIVGQWEWTGSVWASIANYWSGIGNATGSLISASTLAAATEIVPFSGTMLLQKVVYYVLMQGVPDASNYWQIMFSMVSYNFAGAIGNPEVATTVTLNNSQLNEVTLTTNSLVVVGRSQIKLTKVGSAPSITRAVMLYTWKAVR